MSTSVDAAGQLLFPASVERVEPDGSLLLQYFKVESDGTQVPLEMGRELPEWVSPRVQMPWHPTHLQDILEIFLKSLKAWRCVGALLFAYCMRCRGSDHGTVMGEWSH